jgi:polyferredoxin
MANMRPPSKTLSWLKARSWVQTAFLLVWLDPLSLRLHNICSPVFHCYACPLATFACPIGVIANFSALHIFPFLAVGTLLAFGGLVGAFICGWVCPFGLLQDLFAKIPTPRLTLPSWAGHFRYAVLVGLVLLVPFLWGDQHPLFICRVCPAGALEGAVPFMAKAALAGQPVPWPSVAKISITVLFLVAIFFTYRPWCVLFCPLGAVFGLSNRFSAVFLKHDPAGCTNCGACRKLCRYGVEPDRRANDPRCIRCLECTRCGVLTVSHVLKKAE